LGGKAVFAQFLLDNFPNFVFLSSVLDKNGGFMHKLQNEKLREKIDRIFIGPIGVLLVIGGIIAIIYFGIDIIQINELKGSRNYEYGTGNIKELISRGNFT